jgi:putative restriction endonuclease
VRYVVLTTRPEDNLYGDTPTSYSFPQRYLSFFGPLGGSEEIMAVLYEPRRGRGRQSYVGWTTLRSPAQPDEAQPAWWTVRYAQEVRPFPRIVPRTVNDRAFEDLLRRTPLPRHGSALQGSSVREVSADDFLAILAYAGVLPADLLPEATGEADAARTVRESVLRRLARDGSFRARVLRAYDYRCAVSGIGHLDFNRHAYGQLVDGAHLRPVAAGHGGDDATNNGLALTPSLHRLFDAGLFTLGYEADQLLVFPSPALGHYNLTPSETGARLPLMARQTVRLPIRRDWWPDPDALAYHRANVYRA